MRALVIAAALGVPAAFGVGVAVGVAGGDDASSPEAVAATPVAGPVAVHPCPDGDPRVVAEVVAGQVLWVTGRSDDGSWVRVALDDGSVGWLAADRVATDGDVGELPAAGCAVEGADDASTNEPGGAEEVAAAPPSSSATASTAVPVPTSIGPSPTAPVLPPGGPAPSVPPSTTPPGPTTPPATSPGDVAGPALSVSLSRTWLYTQTGVPPCSGQQTVDVLVQATDPSGPVTVSTPTWAFTDSSGVRREGVAVPVRGTLWRIQDVRADVLAGPVTMEIEVWATDGRGNRSRSTPSVQLRPSDLECIG